MKKFLLILSLFTGSFFSAMAQDNNNNTENTRQEKIQALYVAYVTQQLQLTPDEAQKFWPVHTQFTTELKAIKKDLPELDKQQARLDIKKRYLGSFNKILGPNRSERFFRMESEFRKKLLDKVNNNPRQNQRPRLKRGG
ncbi:MAG TPA: hypothetical protein PK987_00860 [Ferruginibacter sp.]|nr:hypothetical protein [Ferruginibacter sp.]